MQPQLMEVLQGIGGLRAAAVGVYGTRMAQPIRHPAGHIGCSLLASELSWWAAIFVPLKFKLHDSKIPSARHQWP